MTKDKLKIIEGDGALREQAAAWFARMRADDASANDRQRLQAWLDRDERHRDAYSGFERMWADMGDFAMAPGFGAQLAAARAAAVKAPRRRPLRWLAAAAAVLFAAVGAWWTSLPSSVDPGVLYSSAVGERRSIALDDGSRIDLDTDSQVRVRFSAGARDIALERGRAYFDVAHDASRPMVVATPEGGVRVIGTRFDVYRRDAGTEIALFEGKVALLSPAADGTPRQTVATLLPGQRARLEGNGASPKVTAFSTDGTPTWTSGRLVFEDTPLPVAVAEFNRYRTGQHLVTAPSVAGLSVNGVFRSDDPDAFVEAVGLVYGLSATTSPQGDIVLSEPK